MPTQQKPPPNSLTPPPLLAWSIEATILPVNFLESSNFWIAKF